jgi:hypothetical protein
MNATTSINLVNEVEIRSGPGWVVAGPFLGEIAKWTPEQAEELARILCIAAKNARVKQLREAGGGLMKKSSSRLKPDLKTCVRNALRCASQQLEELNIIDLYGDAITDSTPVLDAKVYEDARTLAIAYIKKGAEL